MIKRRIVLAALFIESALLSCRGPEGPVGPQGPPGGTGSLTDPAIQPKVIYTFPPQNSEGPYDQLYQTYNQLEVRFNKIMDRASVIHGVTLSSLHTIIRLDTTNMSSLGEDLFLMYPVDSPRYYGYVRWRIGETYSFGVRSTARDVNGNYLTPSYSMTFHPEPYFRIREEYPPDGSVDVIASAYIGLVFNSPVDTSILSEIEISPLIQGRWVVSQYDSVYVYHQSYVPLGNNTSYSITVSANAHDKAGNQLPQQFTTSFTTAPFREASEYPADGSVDVPPTGTIYVRFTAPIDTSTIRSAFSIAPAVDGIFGGYYSNSDAFYFTPSPQFLSDTVYVIKIDTSLRSSTGTRLVSEHQFSFKTAPFQISWTVPDDGQPGFPRTQSILISFNARLDTATVRTSFSLQDSTGRNVPGIFNLSLYGGPIGFTFYPDPILSPKALYIATISTNLRALGGSRLKSPYTFSFTTGN